MNIRSHWFWLAPDSIDGAAVVIDAYAATTNIVTFLGKGARVFLVDEESYQAARKQYPDAVVAGESQSAVSIEFDLPNTPASIAESDVSGRTVLYMSINGTKAIAAALDKGTGPVIACAFTNVHAVSQYLKALAADTVTILMSGDEESQVLEDKLCADVLESEIRQVPYEWDTVHAGVTRFVTDYYGQSAGSSHVSAILEKDKYLIVPVCLRNTEGIISVHSA